MPKVTDDKIDEKRKKMLEDFKQFRESGISPGAEALAKVIQDEELMKKASSSIVRMIDGEPVNIDPLPELPIPEIPIPEMSLYFVDDNYFDVLYNSIQSGYDIVIGGYRRVTIDKIQFQVTPKNSEWSRYIMMAPWAKMYKRDFLLENKIEFLDYGLGEDVYFSLLAYSCTDKIKIIDYIGYNWYFNNESVSNTSQKGFNKELDPVFLLNKIYERIGKKKEEYSYFYVRYGIWYLLFSGRYAESNDFVKEYKNLFSWYKSKEIKIKFPLLSKKTEGETKSVKLAIGLFIIIHKLGLTRVFANIYCKGRIAS